MFSFQNSTVLCHSFLLWTNGRLITFFVKKTKISLKSEILLALSFRRVFGAASSNSQCVETESAESAGNLNIYLTRSFRCASANNKLHIKSPIYSISIYKSNQSFCKQHCRQEILKSHFPNSTFCRFFS